VFSDSEVAQLKPLLPCLNPLLFGHNKVLEKVAEGDGKWEGDGGDEFHVSNVGCNFILKVQEEWFNGERQELQVKIVLALLLQDPPFTDLLLFLHLETSGNVVESFDDEIHKGFIAIHQLN
jgi:hypothetical protein